jgi:hypothetical protein
MKRSPNAQYNVAESGSFSVRLAARVRRRMFDVFMHVFSPAPGMTVLDVGATSDETYESSNYLEALYPYKDQIVACGIDDASHLELRYPGVKFIKANGLQLPFRSKSFDLIHSSAVLEHVGSLSNQALFIHECARVAKCGFLLTTPNRWFPIEYHTQLPLLHWLPKERHRALLRRLGYGFFADEANLNLLSLGELRTISGRLAGFETEVATVHLLGWSSNLLLIGRRQSE